MSVRPFKPPASRTGAAITPAPEPAANTPAPNANGVHAHGGGESAKSPRWRARAKSVTRIDATVSTRAGRSGTASAPSAAPGTAPSTNAAAIRRVGGMNVPPSRGRGKPEAAAGGGHGRRVGVAGQALASWGASAARSGLARRGAGPGGSRAHLTVAARVRGRSAVVGLGPELGWVSRSADGDGVAEEADVLEQPLHLGVVEDDGDVGEAALAAGCGAAEDVGLRMCFVSAAQLESSLRVASRWGLGTSLFPSFAWAASTPK